jgi:hypothetical protein
VTCQNRKNFLGIGDIRTLHLRPQSRERQNAAAEKCLSTLSLDRNKKTSRMAGFFDMASPRGFEPLLPP